MLSEQMAHASGWQRGALRTARGVSTVTRGYFLVLAAAGIVSLIVAVATSHRAAAGAALVTLFIAGSFLALSGGAPETVREVRGSASQFVIRIGPRKVWRIERGTERLRAFANGGIVWRVAVRRRQDDPLGAVAHEVLATTERDALGVADALERQLRSGDLLAG
jgi:hypothetical protein